MEERNVFSTNGAGTTGYPYGKQMDLIMMLILPYTKINFRWITD